MMAGFGFVTIIQIPICHQQLDLSDKSIFTWVNLHYSTKRPLVACSLTLLGDDYVTNGKISLWLDPLLSDLQHLKILFTPSQSELVAQY